MRFQENTAKLARALTILRRHDKEMPIHQVLTLLYVESNDGCTINEILDLLDVTSSTGTRVTTRLGDGSLKIKGLGLIRVEVDHRDRRRRALHITTRGRQVVQQMSDIIGG